jgi:hypothetical protein
VLRCDGEPDRLRAILRASDPGQAAEILVRPRFQPPGLGNVWMTSQEIVDLSLRIVTRIAVTFLNSADQLFGITLRAIEVVIRQFSPPRFDFPFELMPFSFQDIFVHGVLLSLD